MLIILFKIFLILILLFNKINLNKIILEEEEKAKNNSKIPFLDFFCNEDKFNTEYGDCRLPYDKGYYCGEGLNTNNTSGMKWYFDEENQLCFPFGYKGCGGNGNRYENKKECDHEYSCRIMDFFYHSLMCNLNGQDKSKTILCNPSYNSGPEIKCPEGYKCYGYPIGSAICCNIKNEEIYLKNTENKPKCKNGKNPSWYYGKSCEEEFCTNEEECIQLELFAHCCPK